MTFLFFLFSILSTFTMAQDMSPTEYLKLSPEKIKEAFNLESSKHRLGRVEIYQYNPAGKLCRETLYENKEGELVFFVDQTYKYNDKGMLEYESKYMDKKLNEKYYQYPLDNVTLLLTKNSKDEPDTTITILHSLKDDTGKVYLQVEESCRRLRDGERCDSIFTEYTYNETGKLIEKLRFEKGNNRFIYNTYIYKGDVLIRDTLMSDYSQKVTFYKKGLPHTQESIEKKYNRYYHNKYNKYGKQTLSKLYEDGKHIYNYKTYYNKKQQKVKFEMIDLRSGSSGIWLYQYDDSGKLAYKIDLYERKR